MSDFNTQLETEHKLHQKALVWLTTKMLNDERVKITQLASSLRVNVEKAKMVVKFLTRDISNKDRNTKLISIFVHDNKLPDWLKEYFPTSVVAQALVFARANTSTKLYRDLHRQALAEKYGSGFREYLTTRYLENEVILFTALKALGIDQPPKEEPSYPQFDQLKNPDWASMTWSSNAGLHQYYTLESGTKVRFSFGNFPDTLIKGLSDHTTLTLMSRYVDQDVESQGLEKLIVAQTLVRTLENYDFKLATVTKVLSFEDRKTRPALIFVKDHDLRSTISITLPWEDIAFSIA